MKRKLTYKVIIILFAAMFGTQIVNAQSGWEEVYSGSGMFMRDMSFVPGTNGLWETGWAISYEGDIIKTTDGGDTWVEIGQSLSTALAGISFADEFTGMIATLDNKILKSVDGGITWTNIYSGSVNFDKVEMSDALNAVATGTSKLYTTDGGTTWQTGSGGSTYWDLDYASNDTYFGVNLGGALGKSTDGGVNWSDIANLGVFCMSVDFLDEDHGFFGGDLSTIKVTHDGGATWTENTLGGGQDAINCGGFFDQDTIYAAGSSGEVFKSTDGGVSWVNDTSWSPGVFQPRDLVVTGMNVVFSTGRNTSDEGKIWRKIGAPILDADFEADQTDVCAGSSVDFTDMSAGPIDSWSWEFEGGTPATSTDQNPTVTYSTTGKYNVKLVVYIGTLADSITKTDYIEVVSLPDKADAPSGDDAVCTSLVYDYTTTAVEFGHVYDWEVSPSGAGTLEWEDNSATLAVASDWSGDFTLRVRAGNVCGNGDWSDYLEGTVYQSPEEFAVEGGGGFCLGDDGVEITLSGSQTGVDYELYLDGAATGIIIAGTGSELSFGLVDEEGYYSAVASNTNCDFNMLNQVQVYYEFQPLEPATPTGPETVCNDDVSDYDSEGSDDADSYEWVLSPGEAGTLTANGLEVSVDWNDDYSGEAFLSLYGINDCGDGQPSTELEIEVQGTAPEITGEEMVCDWSEENYEVTENEGSTYTWDVTGGTISQGQGTFMLTVAWSGEGNGTITVEEETAIGCSGVSEVFEVMIDDCTGVGEQNAENLFSIHPNPAKDFVSVTAQTNIESIQVFSLTGGLVEEIQVNESTYRLNTSGYHSGLYLIRINSAVGVVSKRLAIK